MKVGKPLRDLKKIGIFFQCPWCFGFWVALLVIVVFHPTANLSSTNGVSRFILDWILLAWMAGVQSFLVKAVIHASKA
jgi:hypothetical protein